MDLFSLRELRRQCGPRPLEAALRAQLESAEEKETRQGKLYMELQFTDGVERLTLRVWEDSPMLAEARALAAPAFVELSGSWVNRSAYGLEPMQWTCRELCDDERDLFLQGPEELREKQRLDYADIEAAVREIADPRLRELCLAFLYEFGERFRRTAAAREYHHARRGGLVEHVAQMMRSAKALLDVYTHLNADLVLAGVLFHDCGKLWENCYEKSGFTMSYNEMSELMSHIPLGIEVVNRLWREMMERHGETWADLTPKSEDVNLHLLHLIASHHGTLEFGSPVMPKTPEAMLLHFVDNIDAKLEMMAENYDKSPLLAKNVYDRRRPLFHPLVTPLPAFQGFESASEGNADLAECPAETAAEEEDEAPEPDEVVS